MSRNLILIDNEAATYGELDKESRTFIVSV